MVEETDEPLEFGDLTKALKAETTDETHRQQMERFLQYRPLKQIYKELRLAWETAPSGASMNFGFAIP